MVQGMSLARLHATCPVSKSIQLLSDTWTMLILHSLLEKPGRFCEIERDLGGISTRTLALRLKRLESEALIKKDSEGFYVLTSKGRGLRIVERALAEYGKKYL